MGKAKEAFWKPGVRRSSREYVRKTNHQVIQLEPMVPPGGWTLVETHWRHHCYLWGLNSSRDSVAWQATVLGITKRQAWLNTRVHVCAHPHQRVHTPRQTRHVQRVHLGAAVPFLRLTFCSALPCSQHPASDPWPHIRESIRIFNKWPWAFQVALVVKNQPDNAGGCKRRGSIPGRGRSPGGGHGNPLQYSCLENPKDRGA